MAALNACQLLVDTQEKGVELSLDTATLENQVCPLILLRDYCRSNQVIVHHLCFGRVRLF